MVGERGGFGQVGILQSAFSDRARQWLGRHRIRRQNLYPRLHDVTRPRAERRWRISWESNTGRPSGGGKNRR